MSLDINLKKGLKIPLKGKAEKKLVHAKSSDSYALCPSDFHTHVPKLLCKEGEKVKQGQPIFYAKAAPEINLLRLLAEH